MQRLLESIGQSSGDKESAARTASGSVGSVDDADAEVQNDKVANLAPRRR